MNTYETIRRESLTWIREAGMVARARFGMAKTSIKPDASPVTDADHAVQAALLDAIASRYPHDAVLTEETQVDPLRHADITTAKRCWVIDPIDGTRNYARSVPLYSVSVALVENGYPVVGMILDPTGGDMYSASAGGGAWLNERRLQTEPPYSADVLIGIPSGTHHRLPAVLHPWLQKYRLRNTGSTALHLAYLAAGGFDAVYLGECHLWDVAAGWLIGNEVGVRTHSTLDRPVFPVDLAIDGHKEVGYLAARPAMLDRLWAEMQAAAE
ncbi:MAG TPA: inositol monophosphatase [Phycisphaerae bacterium]|nr:inositol monophosphatase [Phycisphaerae bacterium]HRY69926.1 inositol monophosphatase [Phycisphaerae bacterium]HSA27135.1 inositol monophosphatase [Phycisphaerae bacterium]